MRLPLSKEQWEFARGLGLEDREYSDKEIDDFVIETVAEYLQMHGFDREQEDTNSIGDMCESIIDAIEEKR